MKKEVFIGVFVGLIANTIGLFFAATLLGKGDDFLKVIKTAADEGFLGKLISLGAILNLMAFFIFIKKKTRLSCKRCVTNYCFYSCFYICF